MIFKSIILGIVEGVTEFLPVSSTGHLILAGDILSFTGDNAKTFEIFIQLGAILSVIWMYRERIFSSIKEIGSEKKSNKFLLNIFTAFLPAAFIGLLTHSYIKRYLFNPLTVSFALIVGGIAILAVEKFVKKPVVFDINALSLKHAFGIGMAQALALFPGVSRAGATIMGAMCLGLERKTATEFSFFLAIPTMFAATSYDLLKNIHNLNLSDMPIFAVGFIVSFLSAIIVIKAFLGFIARHTFNSFAVYRIVFGLIILFYYL
ncbi:undecaprenyl-diphosphatase [Dissulfurispira thermophila]|uniref:Undecaprenyl-diphosphatase n=2 Tax=root TaxID=1 RepID=A0A7G1H1V2_9BACT|nr:undecaprenyl-diphosphate phosphatase [Dissulfurispira thermophila]BCB96764.1 undecaprenyl-diphosphatase [Dissulfurispira thermophila]